MQLSKRNKAYIIPEYSLTGDLLSFLTCNLQYRYQNKGTLPPSMPVQLWFGEFIHGVMEEAYLRWSESHKKFPWDWKEDIRPIEDMIDLRLQNRGLYPPITQFFSSITLEDKSLINERDHKKIASARAEEAINKLGPSLFPLIDSSELLIKGLRDMPNYNEKSRSNYYGINGQIDVLSSIKIEKIKQQLTLDYFNNNEVIDYLKKNKEFAEKIEEYENSEYEIIIDYKGMKRPGLNDENWQRHEWQVMTYSWLRNKQIDSKPVVAGIIFYLNELLPSNEDILAIQEDINTDNCDLDISYEKYPDDFNKIMSWDESLEYPNLSEKLKKDRTIRIININEDKINKSLKEFDDVVYNIENSFINEINGCKIKNAWEANGDERTCKACDFKTFCKKHMKTNIMTVP